MKGSSPILPFLAPPVQIQPQQQATHFSASSTLASQFQSCRRLRQDTIRLQREDVPGLDNKLRLEFLGVEHSPSSFRGDGKALKEQIPWSKENFKSALKSYVIRVPKRTVDVQCFSRPFDKSHRPRGNYPSRVTQLPAEPPRIFHSANVDLNKAPGFNAPGELDQSTPSSPLDFVLPGWKGRPVSKSSSISKHRSSRRAQESTSSQRAPNPGNERRPGRRFETSNVVREEPLPTRSPNRIASGNFYSKGNPTTIEARVESENVMTEQAVLANVNSPSRRRVHQTYYEFRYPWRLKSSRMASEPQNSEAQSAESYRAVGTTGRGNDVAQVEAQFPQSRAGAAKWRKAANVIEQSQNPSRNVLGGIESLQRTIDSLNVEPDRAVGRKAKQTRTIRVKDVLNIPQLELLSREKEGQSTPMSEGGMTRYGSKDWCRDTPQRNGTICIGGSVGQAVEFLQNRLQRGVTTDSGTYVKVLQTCLKQKDLLGAKQVHGCIIESGMDKNLYVAVTLLNVYIKCGKLADARELFDQLEKKTVVTWTNMIAGYAKSNQAQSALEIFNQMRHEGVRPDEVTYLSILKACASPSAIKWGKEIHEYIRQEGFESDVRVGTALLNMYSKCGCIVEARQVFENLTNRNIVTWNAMIGALAQHGHGHEACRLLLQIRQEGFEPNAITYVSILNASASVGALEWVKEVHGHARKAGLDSDVRVGCALVHMYAKSGSIDDARLIFERMEKRDVVTWNAMIGGLAQHGCGHEALELFRKMTADRLKPDETTFALVLSACCHRGLVDDGHRLFSAMMQDYGIEPNIGHYTCMVDLLGRAGHLEEARLLIRDMPILPDAVIWTALLGACRTYGNVELGELAAEELFMLEPGNATAYVLLSNIYAAAGKWENVSLVRSMMQARGVQKEPGRSWIEVNKKVHEFVVGDTSHPEARAIYDELHKLTEKLKAEGYIPDTRLVLHDVSEEDKELALCSHSEKLAIAYGLMHIPRDEPICVRKNLRVCPDCHTATKLISKVTGREIIARDGSRFHHFKDGICSCGDYW